MQVGWFLTLVSVIYGTLLVIVVAWLAQRAAKSLHSGSVPGGETGDWIASVGGALLGFAAALVLTRRGGVPLMMMPLIQLCGLWIGAFVGSLGLRLTSRR